MDQELDDLVIPREVAERILRNMRTWLESKPENDEQWLEKMAATRSIREDFETILGITVD